MKTLDRLMIKAKKKKGIEHLICGFISPSKTNPKNWIARGDIWNGIKGSGIKSIICGEYTSIDEAKAALQILGEQYPNDKNVVIFLDDVL